MRLWKLLDYLEGFRTEIMSYGVYSIEEAYMKGNELGGGGRWSGMGNTQIYYYTDLLEREPPPPDYLVWLRIYFWFMAIMIVT